ncbi:hypothetical protein CJO82_22175 (plasmid) [Ralstonia solanacearum]|nr:hypothetical protein CJO82_22175 [Ralstonia solanacearum]AXW26300.1 hypothetical protein CJO86_22440 [Ralstonia solanacearum]AXW83213.1 hypothetical protein CJO98_22535 [Ralstonia solanacearum]
MPGADSRNNETGVQGHSTWTTTMYALALRASANLCRGKQIMTTFLEIAIAWVVPCLIATAIVAPMVWRKLRTRRTLEAIHHARESRDL